MTRSARPHWRDGLWSFVPLLALASCSADDSWETRDADLQAIRGRFLPPDAVPYFITFDAAARPSWRLREAENPVRVTNELRVATGLPAVLVLRADEDIAFEITAMRVRTAVLPGAPAVLWFVPTVPGTYPVLVFSDSGRWDGTVVVTDR